MRGSSYEGTGTCGRWYSLGAHCGGAAWSASVLGQGRASDQQRIAKCSACSVNLTKSNLDFLHSCTKICKRKFETEIG